MRYKYYIYEKYCQTEKEMPVKLTHVCDSMAEVGRYLDLSINQVRERMTWSNNKTLSNVWHVKYTGYGYQILRYHV